MDSLLTLLIILYAYFIPTFLFAKITYIKSKYKCIYSFVIILFSLPIISFFMAWIINTYISLKVVFIVSTIINFFLIICLLKKKPFQSRIKISEIFNFWVCTIGFVFLIIFTLFFFNFKGLGFGYWDTYIILPAALMTNSHVNLIDPEGKSLYEYELPGNIPNNLVDKDSFGISTKDQRIGSSIFYSLPYLFFGKIGFRVYYALIGSVLFLLGFIFANNIFHNKLLAIFSGIILSVNPYILYVNRLNPNILGLLLLTLIFCLITEKKIPWLIVGICFGILGSIRNVAILFLPSLMFIAIINYKFKLKKPKIIINNLLLIFIGGFIFIAPILLWNQFAFGNIFEHPTQYHGLYGFRPTFKHTFIGINFDFNGLLNHPFIDYVVRTPHFPYPTFLTIPLTIISSFGTFLFALLLFGIFKIYKHKRSLFMLFILFSVPFYLFIIFQENWEDVKTTFILLLFNPLIIFITGGLLYFVLNRKTFFLKMIKFIFVIILITLALKIISNLEFEKDSRWFERFPEAKENNLPVVFKDPYMRDEWQFFHTDETFQEITKQKKLLILSNVFPSYILRFDTKSIEHELLSPKDNLTLVDVWKYIY